MSKMTLLWTWVFHRSNNIPNFNLQDFNYLEFIDIWNIGVAISFLSVFIKYLLGAFKDMNYIKYVSFLPLLQSYKEK